MNLIGSMFRGMVSLSFIAVITHGCSVKEMAHKAAEAHKKGLSSYGAYSRMLTDTQK
jgi:hypothetical protein